MTVTLNGLAMRHTFLKSLLSVFFLFAVLAGAQAATAPEWPFADRQAEPSARSFEDEEAIRLAQGNCAAAAAQAAAQTGGQVLSVSARQQDGRTVCVVTVLVPGQDGGRPRRTTITIPG